jgi:hypothetical protein
MEWYYAVEGEQKGPVNDDEFRRLAQQGVITPQTLVWREGLANWQPYAEQAPPPPPLSTGAPPPNGVVCSNCRGIFPAGEVVSIGGAFHCVNCKPLALQRIREGAGATSAVEEMRNEHLKHEASIRSVGILYYLGGIALIVMGMLGFAAGTGSSGRIESTVFGVIFLGLGVLQILVGTGIRRLQRWSRIPVGILSGIGLLGFPMGTLINGYILYLVFSKKGGVVFSDEYKAVIEQTPHIKYRTSIVVWILLALIVALIVFAIVAALVGRR